MRLSGGRNVALGNRYAKRYISMKYGVWHMYMKSGGHNLVHMTLGVFKEKILAPFRARPRRVMPRRPLQSVIQRRRIGEQRHPRLFRRAVALTVVANLAGGHQIFGQRPPAARLRQDVIERQIEHRAPAAAILAAVVVAREDAMAVGHAVPPRPHVNVVSQTNDRRRVKNKSRRTDPDAPVNFERFGHPPPHQRQSLRRGHETQWLV
jgi:hypothetical protein